MNYFVKRGEEQLGPYSLVDLQRNVQSGAIDMGDLARSEGMSDWAPVSQVLGNIPVPVTPYGAAVAPAMAPVQTVPLPPNLHWVFVLILNMMGGVLAPLKFFNLIWALVLANWARKLDGNNNTLVLVAMYPAGFISAFVAVAVSTGSSNAEMYGIFSALMIIGGVIAYIIGIFKIKHAMEEYYTTTENMGLRLNGAMTFFFSTIYLQYHVNQIAKWKKENLSLSLTS
jgi:uncharacterized protein DUF4339